MGSLVCTVCVLKGQKALNLILTSVEEIFLPATSCFELGSFNQFNLLPIKGFLIGGEGVSPILWLTITLRPFSKTTCGPGDWDQHLVRSVFLLLLVSDPAALVWVSSLAAASSALYLLLSLLSAPAQATFCFGISPAQLSTLSPPPALAWSSVFLLLLL